MVHVLSRRKDFPDNSRTTVVQSESSENPGIEDTLAPKGVYVKISVAKTGRGAGFNFLTVLRGR
jgi:hypothetical protein